MKYLLALVLLASCATRITDRSAVAVKEIAKYENEMNDLAAQIGFNKATFLYADSNVVLPSEGNFSTIGKTNMGKKQNGKAGLKTLAWAPYKIEASKSGDLGYALGHWTIKGKDTVTGKDTTLYGDYVTIWKKQPDGKWKFVLDTGNGTPKPTK